MNSPDGSEVNPQGKSQNKLLGNKSSLRFQGAMWIESETVVQRPEVIGLENLEKIPKGISPIIACTHLRTERPLQIIARELDKKFDIGIALQADSRNPVMNTLFTLVGQDNFYDIDNTKTVTKVDGKSERKDKYTLNFNNYDVMKEAMEKGKTMLIAAHYSPIFNGILPNKPGFAAIYLAHLSGQRVVLPVALDVYTDDSDVGRLDRASKVAKNLITGKRPKSKMTICEPIILDPIESSDIVLMKKWLTARLDQTPSELNSEEREKAVKAFKRMRQDGEKMMYALAEALPSEKRGVWVKNQPANS
jgi:hypothetical protein